MNTTQLFYAATILACGQSSYLSPQTIPHFEQSATRRMDTHARSVSGWRKITVLPLGEVAKVAVDSVITVGRLLPGQISVIYAFNNPCQDKVEALTRREGNVIDVRFVLRPLRESNLRTGEGLICPSSIEPEGFLVVVQGDLKSPVTIRAFGGTAKDWALIREREVTAE